MDDYHPPNQVWPDGRNGLDSGQILGSRSGSYLGHTNHQGSMSVLSDMSNFSSSGQIQNGEMIPTPNGLASLPVVASQVPVDMFMKTVNFEAAMKNQEFMPNATGVIPGIPQEAKKPAKDARLDVLEHQQSIEQARLLQRFKELRTLQLQQQEVLMQQQQEQLKALQVEQQRAQAIIAKQKEGQSAANIMDPILDATKTPPVRMRSQNPGMSNMAREMVPQPGYSVQMPLQPKGQLPRPVMYIPEEEDTDEVKTNPDLFSDTNSHVGSQGITDDGGFSVLDSASEVGGEVVRADHCRPDVRGPGPLLKLGKDKSNGDTDLKTSRETDPDEGFGTQSFRSSGQTDNQGEDDDVRQTGDDMDYYYGLEQHSLDDAEVDDDNEEQDTINDRELDEEHLRPDDRPIKPGVAGKMTFEEMLEQQLQAEQERIQEDDTEDVQSPRRPFLKRGEGIARFGMKANQKGDAKIQKSAPLKPTRTSLLPPPKTASTSKPQAKKTEPTKQPQSKLVLRTSPKSTKTNSLKLKPNSTNQKTGNKQSSESNQSGSTSNKHQTQNQRSLVDSQKTGLYSDCVQKLCSNPSKLPVLKPRQGEKNMFTNPPDSIPDDASFVAKLKHREMNVEFEQEELEEFEMLENFADNASFSSNSSLVVKVMQKDKMKQTLPKVTQSPRQSVAKQIEAAARKDIAQTVAFNSLQSRQQESEGREITKDVSQEDKLRETTNNKDLDDTITEESESEDSDTEDDDDDDDDESSSDDSETELQVERVSSCVQTDHGNMPRNTDMSESSNDKDLDGFFSRSPSKIMTRKVASKEDRSTLNTVSNLLQKLNPNVQIQPFVANPSVQQEAHFDPHNGSLNSSAFLPQGKSPIVISRDVVNSKHGASTNLNSQKNLPIENIDEDEETDDSDFKIHGKFSSPQLSSDVSSKDDGNSSEDSDTSYSALKISARKGPRDLTQEHKRLSSDNKVKLVKDDSESRDDDDDDDETDGDDNFDDNEEWGNTTLKAKSPGVGLEPSSTKEGVSDGSDGTPPTSKLMSKLFPKLKPQPSKQQQQQEQKLQAVSNASTGDGVQSKILRDKLAELEKEIEKFRNENANLERLRREREEGLTKLKKEIVDFEKEKNTELQRIQEYKNEETKKLKHEKKMFERYQKTARAMPDKKEREEIEMLKNQLTDLQEEMKRKETRWTNSSSRLRSKIEQLETENSELKEEIKLMEKKRLEWLQKEQSGKNKTKPAAARSASPSREPVARPVVTHNSADFQTTDSDEEMDPVRDNPRAGVSQQSINPAPSQSQTGLHPTRTQVNVRAPHTGDIGMEGQGFRPWKPNPPTKSSDGPWSSGSVKSSSGLSKDHGSLLRSSLTEEVPRQDCRATAVPQDTSMYTDTEDVPYSKDLPRKRAAKINIDRLSIDKGDSHYEEVQHSDGKIERVYRTGAREILFSNGTRKEISADGLSIIVSFFNGDMKQIMPDQRIVYYYAEAQTTHSTYPDGLEILQFPNNQVEKHYPDGTKEIVFPDQTIKYLFQNGSEESIFPDGIIIRVDKNGDKTMEFPNGQREIHTQEYKRREYPDGTVKTVYPDGRQETRYSNGRIRVKDRDGNIIVDRRC